MELTGALRTDTLKSLKLYDEAAFTDEEIEYLTMLVEEDIFNNG